MKKETLDRGNELLRSIKLLKEHLEQVFGERDKYGEYRGNPIKEKGYSANFMFQPWFTSNPRELQERFLPFPLDKFMIIYKANVEEEIARLEKEFDNLQ